MFVDRAEITIKAGNGGNGCCSFRREAFIPKGGPNGGDGAKGGDVIFVADPGRQSLADFIFNRRFAAQDGEPGKGKDMHGHTGKDCIVKIPPGTLVYNQETGDLLADINEVGKEYVIAVGGKGGKGNARFATSTNRAPRYHEEGEKTQEINLRLDLKLIADIGLVGYPNAGKSTLLSAISNAKPKVAPYPFTTLHPVIGVVDYDDFDTITIADIPGLIDGAHLNVGLGHYFLRHIERTKLLVYVVDTAGVDGRDPAEDIKILKNELEEYMHGLSDRAGLVIANKMDLPEAQEKFEDFAASLPKGMEFMAISASSDKDFAALKEKLRELVRKAEKRQKEENRLDDGSGF